jgi:hypothetical protein
MGFGHSSFVKTKSYKLGLCRIAQVLDLDIYSRKNKGQKTAITF